MQLTLQTSLVTCEEGYALARPVKDFTVCMPREHADNLVAFQAANGANGEAAPHREATVPGQGADHACFAIMFQAPCALHPPLPSTIVTTLPRVRRALSRIQSYTSCPHALSTTLPGLKC